ncbi:ABC transporter substrate-binding protein [Paractinoplanes rishiriensis]|uniref:ABC transporter substrate-binding protein n=1 Tax=Paractinoplanes rishiriensis TaxID=1050105 RepID=A0A919MW65_9ACTN|nr:ABC transporter substrate-binding protein [Actinoplanes rishiriensis]GIF02157.1 ABC transporter substrate-binding protein [Actinoplanes rishiriensis]
MFSFLPRRSGAAAIAVVAVLALTGCSIAGDQGSSSAGDNGPIKIAMVNAQTGQFSSLGEWALKGAKLVVEEWNAAGGIHGRKIQMDVFDDQGDPTSGTEIARRVASEGYLAVIGSANSSVSVAMAPTLRDAQIPNISSGQSPGQVAVKSPFLFLDGPTSITFDETLAAYLVDRKGIKNIALITNSGSFGKGEHDAFTAALSRRGVTPVADQVVTTGQKDFRAALTAIQQKKPALIFVGAEEVQCSLIVRQAREMGVMMPFAGTAPLATPLFLETAGPAAEGATVSSPYLSNDTTDASRKFAAAYKAAYNEVAELHGAKAHDAAQILFTALKTSKVAKGKALADAIRATRFEGLLGDFTYDDTGVGIFATSIGTIVDGKVAVTG